MKIITAKVLDQTHLELSQPIIIKPGKLIQISIPDEGIQWRTPNYDKIIQTISKVIYARISTD